MRLIDADELLNDLIFPTKQFEKAFTELINDCPTIEVGPTCEYCEYAEKTTDIELYYCKKYQSIHYDDFYCSEGQLKDEHDVGSSR